MKTATNFLIIILSLLISAVSCTNENVPPTEKDNSIHYLKSSLGGCNNNEEQTIKHNEEENDTVIISLSNDKLNIFAGLNYICCAPFVTDCKVKNDSIFISITDTCSNPYQDCYCRCDCYYTFDYDFELDNVSDRELYWQIVLNDPREESDILFNKGIIKVNGNN